MLKSKVRLERWQSLFGSASQEIGGSDPVVEQGPSPERLFHAPIEMMANIADGKQQYPVSSLIGQNP